MSRDAVSETLPVVVTQAPPQRTACQQLSKRDLQLLDAFFVCRNQTDAVRHVLKDHKRPDVFASKWKKKPLIAAAIEERRQNLLEACGVRHEQIVREYVVAGFADIKGMFDPKGRLKPTHELDEGQLALLDIEEVTEHLLDEHQGDLFSGADSTAAVVRRITRTVNKDVKYDALRELKDLAGLGTAHGATTIFNCQINF